MGAYDDVGQGVLINLVRPDEGQKLSTQLTKPSYLVTFATTRILKIYCQETTLRSQPLRRGLLLFPRNTRGKELITVSRTSFAEDKKETKTAIYFSLLHHPQAGILSSV